MDMSMNNNHFDVRENYCASPMRAEVDDVNKMQTPCDKCTSIWMVLRDRSPFDRAALRTYNRLPAQYNTRLETLVFAP
jgi:hypothetical protein